MSGAEARREQGGAGDRRGRSGTCRCSSCGERSEPHDCVLTDSWIEDSALMPLKFFIVPASGSQEAEEELNSFLARHRIVGIDRRWIDLGASSFWALCIDHLPAGTATLTDLAFGRNRVDYKQILSAEEFSVSRGFGNSARRSPKPMPFPSMPY